MLVPNLRAALLVFGVCYIVLVRTASSFYSTKIGCFCVVCSGVSMITELCRLGRSPTVCRLPKLLDMTDEIFLMLSLWWLCNNDLSDSCFI